MNDSRREYQIFVLVPRDHSTGLRSRPLATRDSYSDVGDLADYLISSMVHSGIPREQARAWAETHLDVRPVTYDMVMGAPEPMPLGP